MRTYLKISLLLLSFFCLTFAGYSQDVPNSLGPAPYVKNIAPISPVFDAQVGTRAFTQISSSPTFQIGKSFMESCTITNIGAPFTITFPGGLMYRNGILYTYNQSSPFQLWSVDTVTGVHTFIVNMTGVPQANFTGMCWDGTNVYGVSSSLAVSQIFTVNIVTGVCTPIGTPSATCAGAIAVLGRPGAQYSLFSWDIVLDNLYKWNKTTGVATLVGPLGANTNFGQDGCVDPNDNTFYAMDYSTGPELRKIDTTTGAFQPVLCTYTAQATGLAHVPAGAGPCAVPELLYYRWENSTATTTPNTASAPVGTNPSPYTGTFGPGGMYDTCMVGTGATGTTGILPGWNCNLAATNWTIGFWVKDLGETTTGNPTYLFGDPGSTAFRCFYGGAALPNNILFRGPFTDIIIACPMPGSFYFHFVYDGTNILIYRNGTLLSTNPRAVNLPTGTGFRVAGYTGGAFGLNAGGRMDEFRLYNRVLTPAEITATWNKAELPACLTGIETVNNQIPNAYNLSQNYPNPFNPTTNIKFAIPTSGMVKLVVFDVLGREVTTLVNEFRNAGNFVVDFDASSLSSGVYFYRLESGDFKQTRKMLLVK